MATIISFDKSHNDKLLCEIVDEVAEASPDAVWAEYPRKPNHDTQFEAITYRMLSNAVNAVAWFLHKHMHEATAFETITYLGPNNVIYAVAFFPSPRLSVPAQARLLSELSCTVLITCEPVLAEVESLASSSSVTLLVLPDVDHIFNGSPAPFPCGKTFQSARNEPFLVLHTSGSTGNPKLIVYTHEFFQRNVNAFQLSAAYGNKTIGQLLDGNRFVNLLPLFHFAGYCFTSVMSHFHRSTVVLPAAGSPPTANTLHALLMNSQADWAAATPAVVEALGKDPDLLHAVSEQLNGLVVLGGNASMAIGNKVASKLRIYNLIGSSECGGFAQLLPMDKLQEGCDRWRYIQIHPDTNPAFEEHSVGLFELVIKRSGEASPYQPVFDLFPDMEEFRTKDLFAPHPLLPNLWEHKGRLDDVIVFLNGEKSNPVPFELHVTGHPDVAGAVVFGKDRQEAGILVEPTQDKHHDWHSMTHLAIIEVIWPTIQQANLLVPAFARIAKTHICIVAPGKPLPRSPKGSIQRSKAVELYKEEIDNTYEISDRVDETQFTGAAVPDLNEICRVIRTAYTQATLQSAPDDDENFFEKGMDSLEALRLMRELRSTHGLVRIELATVYSNPTVRALSKAIKHNYGRSSIYTVAMDTDDRNLKALHDCIDEYGSKVRTLDTTIHGSQLCPTPTRATTRPCIVITGTTGSVGSYILNELMLHSSKPKIICLNRAADGRAVQIRRNRLRDASLCTEFPLDRVRFLTAKLTTGPDFGLSQEDFSSLLAETTFVIHCAWLVDFNLPLSAFRASLDGLVNLVRFCSNADNCPSLLFVSSISAVMARPTATIPEALIDDMAAPLTGYGETVVRVGQVSGAAHSPGHWNDREWLPRLVVGSKLMGVIPETLGSSNDIDWIPIDVLAKSIVEIGDQLGPQGPYEVYHLVNPAVTNWQQLLPHIIQTLETKDLLTKKLEMRVVSGESWLHELRKAMAKCSGSDDDGNPALALLSFYERMFAVTDKPNCCWAVQHSTAASVSFRNAGKIKPQWMQRWTLNWLHSSSNRR
ncbi:hypothetical protein NLG97_g334 [Lecanicillium saksenae]|uniref:Uncharacterized protein n=1 Tax=Lecanicillium saksenae TaxID=468837 RepID=A0ACC1R8S1_9HYPO|nr:hypothetical protein NLG97_g334 [Lecanicillium saksenae]